MVNNKFGIKEGDIFHSTWGYNMTGHSFYRVVALKGAATLVLEQLKTKNVADDGYGQVGELTYTDEAEPGTIIERVVKETPYGLRIKPSVYEYAYLLKDDELNKTWHFDYLD